MWLPYNSHVATIQLLYDYSGMATMVQDNSHMATIHSTRMQGAEGISMFLPHVDTIWDL